MPPIARLKPQLARPLASVYRPRPNTTSSHRRASSTSPSLPPAPPSRWLADLNARLGRCLIFGCSPAQIGGAAEVLRVMAADWRRLLAGSEGFLTGGRRGLEGREVVWGEMDSFGHVNNVNYARYAESSRVNWMTNYAVDVDPAHAAGWRELMTPRGIGLIMKSIQIDFKLPMTYPDTISVYHKLRNAPEQDLTSLILDCVVLSHRHRRPAARAFEDISVYDYRAARKTVMPEFMHKVLSETWRQQEETRVEARTRIWQLIGMVEALEKETWNRQDAVEDVGDSGRQK